MEDSLLKDLVTNTKFTVEIIHNTVGLVGFIMKSVCASYIFEGIFL